jgi:UDP-GlcNAc:undecaprenyl-phosphate GlcNAc-1-phosphate transferase
MKPDRGHFHHRLIDMGFSQKQAVAIAYAISGILGLSAVVITTKGEIKAIILLVAFLVAGGIGLVVVKGVSREQESKKQDDEKRPDEQQPAAEEGQKQKNIEKPEVKPEEKDEL